MSEANEVKQKVIEVLKSIYDPEIPINIYDLGLVYEVNVSENTIEVVIGLTTPLCPIAHIVLYQVESVLKQYFSDKNVVVKLDLERLWSPERMTEEGRKLFRLLYGHNILEKK